MSMMMTKTMTTTSKADDDSKGDDEEQFPNWAAVNRPSEKKLIVMQVRNFIIVILTNENNQSLSKEVW